MPHPLFHASDFHLKRRAASLAIAALLAFASLAVALAGVIIPARPAPASVAAPPRGELRSADGRVLAGGDLPRRVYPLGPLAAPVIGFVGASGGLEGLERASDPQLRRGEDLTLTLDTRVQAAAESILTEALERTDAEYASAAVLDTRSGDLLALASVPGFDPNAWRATPPDRWRNRAVLDEYEPGSVVKALTVAALLNEGRTTPDTQYDTPMWRRFAGATINDIVAHPPTLKTRQILRYSSNVGMTRLVEGVPAELLHRYFTAYGFGRPVRLGLPAGDGLLRDPADWSPLTQATQSFGQGLTVTTLQLAVAFNVLANDGRYVTPRILAGAPSTSRRVLTPQTAATMRELLHGVVDDGIKTKAELPGYHVGGKTGTAQVVVDGRYSAQVFSSTFAGFLPAARPRFTVAVMVRGAKREYQGSQLAAPIFREISSTLLSLYALRPEMVRPPTAEP
ncbi:penicillin-binding protein 2 (plasmid) [Deinococcus aetherius]|uniref:Penicillin-binding protein 2 n=1 Tax=Deinococcus aetherius TaxID=200252 RepID=A0ABN6RMK4_9DEIO|nr:penicillin-binding protein 2 [Deinococcus aetherius]BDP44547.1 penicillin-binding protein 2 [Deinococcus aetherius]